MLLFLSPFLFFFSVALWPFNSSKGEVPPEQVAFDLPQNPKDFEFVRISLMENTPRAMVETAQPFQIFDREGRLLLSGDSMTPTSIEADGEAIRLGTQIFRRQPITLQSKGDGFKLGDRHYRDSLVLWLNDQGKIDIINELALEAYLRGVLPWEANPEWSMESLKAQAVAARSYALFQIIKKQDAKFDLSRDVLSQVYAGKTVEKKQTDQAITETRGQILTYRGQVLAAYYHSTCGGATTRADTIWNVEWHPALNGVTCEFCKGTKHYRWENIFSKEQIQNALTKRGYSLKQVQNIRPVDWDASGRARKILIEGAAGNVTIPSNDFRIWMDPFKFKSTLIESVEPTAAGFKIKGKGWGHGVGLCQFGMKQLGELGYTYRQILSHYYPETDVIQYYS